MNSLIAGVIGWPVSQSLSPRLHGYWLQQMGINGAYVPLSVDPERLPAAVAGLKALGFKGCNVTVPHKENVVPLLKGLSETATRIRAVNTIIVRNDGTLFGDSTDGTGFMNALQEEAPTWPRERPVVVLGAGGAARAIVDALHEAGVPEIRIINRTPARAERLGADLRVPVRIFTWGQAPLALADAGLLVNTTTLGMTGQPDLTLPLEPLPLSAVVFDIVYKPLETTLLRQAAVRGHSCVGGLGMLMHQAVPGFAAWFGQTPAVTDGLRRHLLEALA